MLTPMLSVAGYVVRAVASAQEAMQLCEHGEQFDVIISDIEMPGTNGFEFAASLHDEDCPWKDVPVVALSSHTTPADLERGRNRRLHRLRCEV